MNMASALGLTSPTIEGRIILTAENKTAEGFDAARKQLDEFQKEAAKIQIELNTHKRTVMRQQRDHIREVEKVGKITGEMFSKISAAAVGAFAVVSETIEHFSEVYRELEQRAASREILLRANTNISPASIHESALRIANQKHLKSVTDAEDILAALVSRGVDKYEGVRRYNTLLNAAGFSRQSPESIQGQISEAIRIGRPTMFAKILGGIDPNYFGRPGTQQRERLTQRFEELKNKPQEAEALFFDMLKEEEKKVKGFSTAWEKYNKANESYNDAMRAREKLIEEQATLMAPLYDKYYNSMTAVMEALDSWPKPIRDAVLATGALGSTVLDLVKEFGGLAAELGVLWAILRKAKPAAAATASPAAGTAAATAAESSSLLGRAARFAGRWAIPAIMGWDAYKIGTSDNPAAAVFGGAEGPLGWLEARQNREEMERQNADESRRQFVIQRRSDRAGELGGTRSISAARRKDIALLQVADDSVRNGRSGRGTLADATAGIEHFTVALDHATLLLRKLTEGGGINGGLGGGRGLGVGGGGLGGGALSSGAGFGAWPSGSGMSPGGGMVPSGSSSDVSSGSATPGGSSSLGSMSDKGGFLKRAAPVMAALQRDLGITKEQAAGIVGSLKPESGLLAIQEGHPRSGKGGFGWAQWTGPRRKQFEAYARDKGLSVTSDEANYGFLLQELRGKWPGKASFMKATTAEQAAHIFTGTSNGPHPFGFLRPGAEHFGASEKWAAKSLAAYDAGGGMPAAGAGGAVVVQNTTPDALDVRRKEIALLQAADDSTRGARAMRFSGMRKPVGDLKQVGADSVARRRRGPPLLRADRDPLNNLQTAQSLHLGRGAVDVNLKLDRQLAAAGPASIYHASNFDLGVNVDRTGHPFSRPGDPAFPPPPSYA